jgi:NAD(P)-dependent dehydrogenase (short-subunit alcohol dehydrogenase family)
LKGPSLLTAFSTNDMSKTSSTLIGFSIRPSATRKRRSWPRPSFMTAPSGASWIDWLWAAQLVAANVATRAIKRDAEPEDLIGALLFLSSADSDFMTGQTIVVDGGSVMH